ncbi:helix-turn-helix transcriptional regulator [Paenibacillus allorhizosphaerae]|uniref:YafY family transcriptional regulator n=1 Tax=Paenibacillus allorhizosphaerae TaxID=2849866 RepID=A0ABM8VKU6_9BACL|nr:YafY family protein [Paenibacillus allorhizosphaerae]CAG7647636.1 hypothetical protein PAECIP111802_04026 [Paenibacillus allorhizosphaerae]
MSKADNMLSILWLLKTRKRMTAQQLSEELEIHIRTVYRYIDALCASGVPIVADSGHNGGYSLLDHFTEVPLFFDLDEQKALIQAAIFAQESGFPHGDAMNRAVSKLKRYTNPEQQQTLERHTAGFEVIRPPADAALEAVLQQLELSVAGGRTLGMDYVKRSGAVTENRRIDPYGIVYWKGSWYVVAFCHLRKELRSFRADRIQALFATDEGFERPSSFSASEYFLKHLIPEPEGQEDLVSVWLEGSPRSIGDVCRHWLLGHTVVERSEHRVNLRLDAKSTLAFVPYFLLSYGKSLRVLEPSSLIEQTAELAADLYDYYRTMRQEPAADREDDRKD